MQNNDDHSGSTAVCAFVTPTHIVIANCGDSRALLASNEGNCIWASDDHKPYDEGEKARIEAAGGSVSMKRVNGDLAVSRALGDFVYKQFKPDGTALASPDRQQVSCIPDVKSFPRADHQGFLVLCCDGIWDVMTNEQVSRLMLEVRAWLWPMLPLPSPLSSHPSVSPPHLLAACSGLPGALPPTAPPQSSPAETPLTWPLRSLTRAWLTRARTTCLPLWWPCPMPQSLALPLPLPL